MRKNHIKRVPGDVIRKIADDYLTPRDQSAFFQTSKQEEDAGFRLTRLVNTLLLYVAKGKQDEAEKGLTKRPELLLETGSVTDYSGRIFKSITAYEYAYWAKDRHMCRMLEAHMNDVTKADMLERVHVIEEDGLTYEQDGHKFKNSRHFDMTPLQTALQRYIDAYDAYDKSDVAGTAVQAAWRQLGLAQRDLPVHVINEYCRPDRPFNPLPEFNEDRLPRGTEYFDYSTHTNLNFFSFVLSDSSGLGINWALIRNERRSSAYGPCFVEGFGPRPLPRLMSSAQDAEADLAAVSHLDVVRTNDLKLSLENLAEPNEPRFSYK